LLFSRNEFLCVWAGHVMNGHMCVHTHTHTHARAHTHTGSQSVLSHVYTHTRTGSHSVLLVFASEPLITAALVFKCGLARIDHKDVSALWLNWIK
jgi:hypothetical protein